MSCAVVVAAGGSGQRFQAEKQFADLCGRAVLSHSVAAFAACAWVRAIVVVVAAAAKTRARGVLQEWHGERCAVHAVGGQTRAQSVYAGLCECPPVAWCMVHDAARPCVRREDIEKLWAARGEGGDDKNAGAILAVPAADSLKMASTAENDAADVCWVSEHLAPRSRYWHAQTPQLFPLEFLKLALSHSPDVADESQAIAQAGGRVRLVVSSHDNIKITYPQDLSLAACILQSRQNDPQ